MSPSHHAVHKKMCKSIEYWPDMLYLTVIGSCQKRYVTLKDAVELDATSESVCEQINAFLSECKLPIMDAYDKGVVTILPCLIMDVSSAISLITL